MATQNPIEQEGTYRLPEAQLDRFFFKIDVGYPTLEEEVTILQRAASMRTRRARALRKPYWPRRGAGARPVVGAAGALR